MRKLLATLVVAAIVGSGFAVSVASASPTHPGCFAHGIVRTGC